MDRQGASIRDHQGSSDAAGGLLLVATTGGGQNDQAGDHGRPTHRADIVLARCRVSPDKRRTYETDFDPFLAGLAGRNFRCGFGGRFGR
jgi:hypothetical protein